MGLEVELWRVPTALPHPVMTAAGPYDTYYHLVARAQCDGTTGWGYAGLPSEALLDAAGGRALALLDAIGVAPDIGALLSVEQLDQASVDPPSDTAGKAAACAIALAGWDLAARRLGVPCADLWGRRPGTQALDCYASGFFLDADLDALVSEAAGYRAAGFGLVKMRVGRPVEEDLARFEAIRSVFPAPGAIAVDAFHSWRPEDARAFTAAATPRLLWVEDPTPYADLGQVGPLEAPLAAGESLETIDELDELRQRAGVTCVLLDVQRVGGPLRFLAAAHVLGARGARIGAHIYTAPSAHLMACVDDPLPVEVFDWSDALMDDPPGPGPDGRVPVAGPGFGVALAPGVLDAHGRRLR